MNSKSNKWIAFTESEPPKICSRDNFYLFDIEITEGLSKGRRVVVPVNYFENGNNSWHIPYSPYFLESSFGKVIFHYWQNWPVPNK